MKVAPRRDKHGTRWQWQASVTNDLQQGYSQSTARRIAPHDDVTGLDRPMRSSFWRPYEEEVWRKTSMWDRTIGMVRTGREQVLQSAREGILRSKPIVGS